MHTNGNPQKRWPAAEKHFRNMAAKYVTPAIAYAQQMAGRPWYAAITVAGILSAIRDMEAVHRLYTGPLNRSMEPQLAEADKCFQAAMVRLRQWDK